MRLKEKRRMILTYIDEVNSGMSLVEVTAQYLIEKWPLAFEGQDNWPITDNMRLVSYLIDDIQTKLFELKDLLDD